MCDDDDDAAASRWQFADVFCGCGGASCGATMAGFEVVHAVDAWEEALRCHEENHPDCTHTKAEAPSPDIERVVRATRPGAHLHVHVSPPCQALSTANFANYVMYADKNKSSAHEEAISLVKWAIHFARKKGASWSFEQVVRREITDLLDEEGVDYCVADACYFGVGQQRRRLIAGSPEFVAGIRSVMNDPEAKRTSAGEVIATKGTHLRNRVYNAMTSREDGSRSLAPVSVASQLRSFDQPSWTITGNSAPRWYCTTTCANTYLTVREMATLQGFPDAYTFDTPPTRKAKNVLVGNAVPPPILCAGLRAVRSHHERTRRTVRTSGGRSSKRRK